MKTMQPSTSGALVTMYDDIVTKTGPKGPVRDRVLEQAIFMTQHGSICFPRIRGMSEASYSMELLDPIEWDDTRIEGGVFREAKELLEEHVWKRRTLVRASELMGKGHCAYVGARALKLVSAEACYRLVHWYHMISERVVTAVVHTHGDPTVDNMMQRNGQLVLIDPIPATEAIPALLAVDLGKMLQSARGYEQVKYGYHPLGACLSCEREIFRGEHDNDIALAEYFYAVHLLRLIPYQPEHLRPVFTQQLEEVCSALRV
jgi:hypothetical protein